MTYYIGLSKTRHVAHSERSTQGKGVQVATHIHQVPKFGVSNSKYHNQIRKFSFSETRRTNFLTRFSDLPATIAMAANG